MTNVEENINEQDVDVISQSENDSSMLMASQSTVPETQSVASTSSTSQNVGTPRLSKKRKVEKSIDDEVAQAIVQSLNTKSNGTPLSQAVLEMENMLETSGKSQLKLEFKQMIYDVLFKIEKLYLD